MLLASQKSFLCDYEDMEKLISKCIKKINMEQAAKSSTKSKTHSMYMGFFFMAKIIVL